MDRNSDRFQAPVEEDMQQKIQCMRQELKDQEERETTLNGIIQEQRGQIEILRGTLVQQKLDTMEDQSRILNVLDLNEGRINLEIATLQRKCLPSSVGLREEDYPRYILTYVQSLASKVDRYYTEILDVANGN